MPVQHAVTSQHRTAVRVRRRIAAALSVALLAALLPAGASQRQADAQTETIEVVEETTSAGTDFWFAFPPNALYEDAPTLQLFVTAESAASVTVSVPGLADPFSQSFSLAAQAIQTVTLPSEVQLAPVIPFSSGPYTGVPESGQILVGRGVRVTSDVPVTVYGLNRVPKTTDAFLAYPTAALGLRYRVMSLPSANDASFSLNDQVGGFAIVATAPDTTVTIVPPPTPAGANARTGDPITVTGMNVGDVYQLTAKDGYDAVGDSLSGTLVTADKPIAVMESHTCTRLPEPMGAGMCDHVVQQLLPVSAWGTTYAVPGLAGKKPELVVESGEKRYTVRVIADSAGTVVTIDGVVVATLGPGEVHSSTHSGDVLVQTSRPAMVAQFAHGLIEDVGGTGNSLGEAADAVTAGAIGDPFMLLVPSTDQFLNAYTVLTAGEPGAFVAHYVNLVAFSPDPGITRNGQPVTETFREVGGAGSGVWATSLSILEGAHRFDAADNFGVFVYGWTPEDSYGYPGGSAFRSVGSVTGIAVSAPATGTIGSQACAAAELEAPEDATLTGVQVTWIAEGPEDADPLERFSGRSSSNASGRSQFCFTPTALGTYSVGATAGAGFEDATTVEIVQAPPGSVGQAFTFLLAPDGMTPSVPPGVGVWQQTDGTTVPLAVSSPAPGQVRYEADGVRLTLTGAVGTDAARGLIANPNGEVECEICAQLAAGVIEAWMFSTPRLVAAWSIADLPCQTFTIPVVSPLDGGGPVSAGAHTLQLVLPTASGMQAVNVGVTVGGVVPTRVPAGEGPSVPSGLVGLGLLAAAGALAAARRRDVTD